MDTQGFPADIASGRKSGCISHLEVISAISQAWIADSVNELESAERIEVPTERLDALFSKPEMAKNKRAALLIAVEGAEFFVLEGIGEMAEKVALVHVEKVLVPLHEGQKTLDEIKTLLGNYGLDPIGSNISSNQNCSDVVVCRRNLLKSQFKDVRFALQVAKLQYLFGANNVAAKLKKIPWLFIRLS